MDAALLDVNVAGETGFPRGLRAGTERGVPFLFVTGYGQSVLPGNRPGWEACTKPFNPDHLTACLARKLGTA